MQPSRGFIVVLLRCQLTACHSSVNVSGLDHVPWFVKRSHSQVFEKSMLSDFFEKVMLPGI